MREGAFLNPMVFFSDTLVVDNDSGSPQQVQEVKWAGYDVVAFIQSMEEMARSSVVLVKDFPAVVLEIL